MVAPAQNPYKHKRKFNITVLGRTLEHLGVQMYKRRDVAIAELVANCWDAGAKEVHIQIPKEGEYDRDCSSILITDDGVGMTDDQVQDEYLVVGRNRRRDDGEVVNDRPVMGRKGIGKLAGFGIATTMTVITWRDGIATELTLDVTDLKKEDGQAGKVPLEGTVGPSPADVDSFSGTRIVLEKLKHKTPLDIDILRDALGRRFSRRVHGRMKIFVNDQLVEEPSLPLEIRFPEDDEYDEEVLDDGTKVNYYYAFAENVIRSRELRGFTIHVRGKTAQAPPFFFDVEATASGQHGTKYLTGIIEADFLDEGTDDDDLISTDRQEIDWEDERAKALRDWGAKLTRKALKERSALRGEQMENLILENVNIRARIDRLDTTSQKQVSRFLKILGQAETEDEDRTFELADALVRAYEYQHFHDVIRNIEQVGDNPAELQTLLLHLNDWRVLESRAILEIIKGRLDVVDKFRSMIVNDAPETAPQIGMDNMHDLLAGYPWLLNPEWQVLTEEKSISRQLREWDAEEVEDEDARLRYDFLALSDDYRLAIIEIKRPDHAVTFDELQRLERYKERLSKARDNIHMLVICGGGVDVSEEYKENWEKRPDGTILTWRRIHEHTRKYYEHYRAVLEGEVENTDFMEKEREVAKTRDVLRKGGVYRGQKGRAQGLGPQDVDYRDDGQ